MSLVLLERLVDWLVVAGLLWLAAVTGRQLLAWLRLTTTAGERLLLGCSLGLGLNALGLLALGLVGQLQQPAMVLWLVLQAMVARRQLGAVIDDLRHSRRWLGLYRPPTGQLVSAGLTLVTSLLLTTLPPLTYDGLAYHLAGPRDWLAQGRLLPLPDNPPANYPANAGLLYALLMRLASDSAPPLLHLSAGLLCAALTGLAAQRLLGPRAGWLAALIFGSTPAVTLYAWQANTDLLWTLAEATAGYALLRAVTIDWPAPAGGQSAAPAGDRPAVVGASAAGGYLVQPARGWLVVAGLALGLALGLKYTALGTLALDGLILLVVGWRSHGQARGAQRAPDAVGALTATASRVASPSAGAAGRLIRALAVDLLALGLPALLVGGPWYVRNWLWFGNPVWPTFIGGGDWSAVRLANFTAYTQAIGHPLDPLLPLRLYSGDHENPLGIPSLLFLLLPLLLLRPRLPFRLGLLAGAAAGFVLWASGLREIRLLFPLLPLLSLLIAWLLCQPPTRLNGRRAHRWLNGYLPALALLTALAPPLIFVGLLQPWRPLLGLEPRATYLMRLYNYPAFDYLNRHLPPGGKTLLIGDGRLYYLNGPARSDIFRDALPELLAAGATPNDWRAWLRRQGFSHVLVSRRDLAFVATYMPPERLAEQQALLAALTSGLLQPVFEDREATVYRIIEDG